MLEYAEEFKDFVIDIHTTDKDIQDKLDNTIKDFRTNATYDIQKLQDSTKLDQIISYKKTENLIEMLICIRHINFYKSHCNYLYIMYVLLYMRNFITNNKFKDVYTYTITALPGKRIETATTNIYNPYFFQKKKYSALLLKKYINNSILLNPIPEDKEYDCSLIIEDLYTKYCEYSKSYLKTLHTITADNVLMFDTNSIDDISTIKEDNNCKLSYADTKTLTDTNIEDKSYIISTIDKPASLTTTEKDNNVYWLNIINGTPDNLDDFRNVTNIVIDRFYENLPNDEFSIPEDMDFTSDEYKNAWFIALVKPASV